MNIIEDKFTSLTNTRNGQSRISTKSCNTDRINTNNVSNLISKTTIYNSSSTCNNRTTVNSNISSSTSTVSRESYKIYSTKGLVAVKRSVSNSCISNCEISCSSSCSSYEVTSCIRSFLEESITDFINISNCCSKTNSNLSRIEIDWIRKQCWNLTITFSQLWTIEFNTSIFDKICPIKSKLKILPLTWFPCRSVL